MCLKLVPFPAGMCELKIIFPHEYVNELGFGHSGVVIMMCVAIIIPVMLLSC